MSLLATRADYFAIGRRAIINTPNIQINPAVIDVPGSDVNINLGAMAVMCEEATSRGAAAQRGLFIDTAVKDQLVRLAYDRYSQSPFPSVPSTVDLLLERPTPDEAKPGTFDAGHRVQTPNGLQFALDRAVTFGNFATSAMVPATCLTAGYETCTPAGTIVQFADPPFDTSFSVTNETGAAGGIDAETDVQFRGRLRGFFPTIRRGVLGAIEYGAKLVPGVAVATAVESLNPNGMPAAMVVLTIADRDGNWSSAMVQSVVNKLLEFRSGGIPVVTQGGIPTYQSVVWRVGYRPGIDEMQAQNRLRMVTVAVSQFLPPGPDNGVLYRANLIAAARTVSGLVITDGAASGSSLLIPAGDVVPSTSQETIRVRPQDVTFVA